MTQDDLDIDKTPLSFGKYVGLTPDEISEFDPGYVVWLYRTVSPRRCSAWLYEVCLNEKVEDGDDDYC